MNFPTWSDGNLLFYAFVFLRASAFFFAAPILSISYIPAPLKILFALSLVFISVNQAEIHNIAILDEKIISYAIYNLVVGLLF